MIHVVLCDDHAILRRGIRDTLAEATDIIVTAEAGCYAELREQLRTATCDVLLLDINMPGLNRPEFCRQFKASYFRSNRSPYERTTLPRRIQD